MNSCPCGGRPRRLHLLVRPQVAAADRGAADDDEGIGRLDQTGVGDILDADVAGAVHDGSAHVDSFSCCGFGETHRVEQSYPRQMEITRNAGETVAGPSDWFAGAVYLDAVATPSGACA